ncbi:hypothetical protein GCM10027290_28990 [Micromonospora sonneratiae]
MLSDADSIASIVGTSLALLLALLGGIAAWRRRKASRTEAADSVRGLLNRQLGGVLTHAYRFLDGSVSPLAAIYVPQRVTGRTDSGSGPPLAAEELLRSDRHVLLVGMAGSGKTSFISHALREQARRWSRPGSRSGNGTARPRVRGGQPAEAGLAISATTLVGRSLPEAIVETYRDELPPWLPHRAPQRQARWLVLIDGLDQIIDANARSRVIGQLREWAGRTDHPYRLLLTTRPLAEQETTALRAYFAEHLLLPFDESDRSAFAGQWFAARVPDATRAVGDRDRFCADLNRARLGQLAYNPLLVTLAALVWERAPDRAPDRAVLLDRFVAHLFDGGGTAVNEVSSALRHRGRTGAMVATWLHEQLGELFETAADGWLRTGQAVPSVISWADTRAPVAPSSLLPDWSSRIASLLVGTGLFVPRGVDVEPVARSVVEYLAAGPLARSWPEGQWLALLADPATRGMAGLVLARANVEIGPFLTELAGGDGNRVVAAGQLLSVGVPAPPEVRDGVLAALLRQWYEGTGPVAAECLSVLATLAANDSVRQAVYDIATDPRWPRQVRGAATTFIAVPTLRQRPADD